MTVEDLVILLKDGSAFEVAEIKSIPEVPLLEAKAAAFELMRTHPTRCEVDACHVTGWEVWARSEGHDPILWARYPERA